MTRAPGEAAGARRGLCHELKHLRRTADLTQKAVAEAMGCSVSKLVRIESGQVRISNTDLQALASLYGVHDGPHGLRLLELAGAARTQLWNTYRDLYGWRTLQFLGHEARAVSIQYLSPHLIPALFQIEPYAYAAQRIELLRRRTPQQDERLRHLLTLRQQILHSPDPPTIVSFLDETLIRRTVAGPTVMGEQLTHLEMLAQQPNIQIRIVPLHAGAYPFIRTGFTYLTFAGPHEADLVHIEPPPGCRTGMDRPRSRHDHDPSVYRQALADIDALALTTNESLALIRAASTR